MPLGGDDPLSGSVDAIECLATRMSTAYGACFDCEATMSVAAGTGSPARIIAFAAKEGC